MDSRHKHRNSDAFPNKISILIGINGLGGECGRNNSEV